MMLRAHFGLEDAAPLGSGSESDVYALDDHRVLRINRPGVDREVVHRRRALLDELQTQAAAVAFRVPNVQEVIEAGDEIGTVEDRLPGEPLDQVLAREGEDRRGLLRAYLSAAREIWRLTPERPLYGDLIRGEDLHTHTFIEFAIARARDSLRKAGPDFEAVSPVEVTEGLHEGPKALVHMDFYPGNVLVEGGRVSAVLDFGPMAIIGDRRIDPVSAVLYLDPEITPAATDEDRSFARKWLEANELLPLLEPVQTWLAACWAEFSSDPRLNAWCRRHLRAPIPSST